MRKDPSPRAGVVTVLSTLFFVVVSATASATECEHLTKLRLENTTITSAQMVAAGEFVLPEGEGDASGAPFFKNVPAFCRVSGVIKPSSDSDIRFEAWLPSSGWNGRFMGIGNGGFAGSIIYAGLGNAVANGYASAATDTGHRQNQLEAGWALGHPEKLIDFGHRAIHETAEKGKAITSAFYEKGPRYSYFSSCSNGGRQALMEAQRYAADYDGIIAGAPANYWTHLLAGFAWNAQATSGEGYIPINKAPAIEAASLAACDKTDGVVDGIVGNPAECRSDPAPTVCEAADSEKCLTAPQAKALAKIHAGPTNSNGDSLFPGFPPGSEGGQFGWGPWLLGPAPGKSLQAVFATQFFSNVVFEDLAWSLANFDVDRDVQLTDEKVAHILNATDPELSAFRERGGKLILYHGWADAAIPAQNTIHYYENVVEEMGPKQASSFVRLFMAPGMHHCMGGPGPNSFGIYPGPQGDPEHDIVKALERWVEKGVAPEKIIATKYESDLDPTSGVARTRPLCAHPLAARYKGSGDPNDAASFTCEK